MTPYEILLSESQERMLLVAHAGQEEARSKRIFDKWDLRRERDRQGHDRRAAARPRRTEDRRARCRTATSRTRGPSTSGPRRARASPRRSRDVRVRRRRRAIGPRGRLSSRCSRATPIASKHWIYEQYDHMVRSNTIVMPGARRRRHSHQGHAHGARDVPRRQRSLRVARPLSRRRDRGRRRLPQPRRRRRDPGRGDELPELRQPREARDHVAVRAGRRRHARRVRALRRSHHRRQRRASTTRPTGVGIYPTPVVGIVGMLEDRHSSSPHHFKEEGDLICCSARRSTSSAASEYLEGDSRARRRTAAPARLGRRGRAPRPRARGGEAASAPLGTRPQRRRARRRPRRVPLRPARRDDGRDGGARDAAAAPTGVLFSESHSRILVSVAPEGRGRAPGAR